MYMVILGVLLSLMKYAEIGPVANWPWLGVLLPFAVAVVWWQWADATGYTKRKEIEAMDERKRQRREKNLENLGLGPRRKR